MKKLILLLVAIAMIGLGFGMSGDETAQAQTTELPKSRSFYMGFTPLPYDYTDKAFAETYQIINKHGDIIGHHLDEGVPWAEALAGKTRYHANVEQDIARRLKGTKSGRKVFLSVTPLSLTRQDLAQYWHRDSHLPNPGPFENGKLDSPEVKAAFTAYSLEMIKRFKPTYFAYAIEISDLAKTTKARAEFVRLAAHVYKAVKAKHPRLKVFPTYTLGNGKYFNEGLASLMKDLAPYTDVIAVSTYPYVWDGVGGDSARLPADWFTKIAKVLPGKPFAVAETGFIGGDYTNLGSLVWINSSPASQTGYVQRLLSEAQKLDAEFVIWYVPVDYDLLWKKMKANGMNRWFAQWMRSGLWTADRKGREALNVWESWRSLPRR